MLTESSSSGLPLGIHIRGDDAGRFSLIESDHIQQTLPEAQLAIVTDDDLYHLLPVCCHIHILGAKGESLYEFVENEADFDDIKTALRARSPELQLDSRMSKRPFSPWCLLILMTCLKSGIRQGHLESDDSGSLSPDGFHYLSSYVFGHGQDVRRCLAVDEAGRGDWYGVVQVPQRKFLALVLDGIGLSS